MKKVANARVQQTLQKDEKHLTLLKQQTAEMQKQMVVRANSALALLDRIGIYCKRSLRDWTVASILGVTIVLTSSTISVNAAYRGACETKSFCYYLRFDIALPLIQQMLANDET